MLEQWQQEFVDKLAKTTGLGEWRIVHVDLDDGGSRDHFIRCRLKDRVEDVCPLEGVGIVEFGPHIRRGDYSVVAYKLGYSFTNKIMIVGATDCPWSNSSPQYEFRNAILKAVGLPEE
jgi:hypothetical protein